MSGTYEPEVNDYVVWERETWVGMIRDEGWVYFKGEPVEPKRGFPTPVRYITIETGVKLKPAHQLRDSPKHKYVHTLLLCYEQSWNELRFVKKRESKECEHYSQYDDVHGNQDELRNAGMYKSQANRYEDIQ